MIDIMRKASIYMIGLLVGAGVLLGISCADKAGGNATSNPKGYDLSKPIKYNMPDALLEISGIAFNNGKSDMIYAEQDEEGRLFYFKLGDKELKDTKFGKKGDYEDVAICHGQVIMLRSDGVLFTFPLSGINAKEVANVNKQEGLLPEGEYEGMHADEKNRSAVYIM
jgi:hypothetical protein